MRFRKFVFSLLGAGAVFACSSSSNLEVLPPMAKVNSESYYLAVDLKQPLGETSLRIDGHEYSFLKLAMHCPLGGGRFEVELQEIAFWDQIALGGARYFNPDVPKANVPNPWPLPQCPDNGFPIAKLIYEQDEMAELRTAFKRVLKEIDPKNHVSSYVSYRIALARAVDDGKLSCARAERVRRAAFEAWYLGQSDLESNYTAEAVELGRECLEEKGLPTEQHIQHIVAHINALRRKGSFLEAERTVRILKERYREEEIEKTPGNIYNSRFPEIYQVLQELEKLIAEKSDALVLSPMVSPVSSRNPLLTQLIQAIYLREYIEGSDRSD